MSEYPAAGTDPNPPTNPGESPTKPDETETGSDAFTGNIRYNDGEPLRFNAATPAVLNPSHLYKGDRGSTAANSTYRSGSGINERGMIVRDFNMNERLKAADAGWASTTGNWGFQFHFNPSEVIESFTAPMGIDYAGFILDIAKNPLFAMSCQTGSSVSFNLLLARFEDMRILRQENWRDRYPLGDRPTEEDREEILKHGTQYDLEYLFRVVNLDPVATWHNERSSDWGMLMGTPIVISLGDSQGCRKYRGSLRKLGVQHQQYAMGMIPVYTIVTLEIQRITDMYGMPGSLVSAGSQETGVAGSIPSDTQGTELPIGQDTSPNKPTWAMPTPASWHVRLGFKTPSATNPDRYVLGAHTGIDIWNPKGDSWGHPAYAVADAVVAKAGRGGALGFEVVLYLEKSKVYVSYAHLREAAPGITKGARVNKGDRIGVVGDSGITGKNLAHLHLEVRNQVEWVKAWSAFQDPAQWLLGKSSIGWQAAKPHSLKG